MIEASASGVPFVPRASAVIGRVQYWIYVVLLSALGMMASFSIDTYLPAFATIARDFSVRQEAVQQSLTVFLVTWAITMLFYGTLSDTFGRRRVILLAMSGFVTGAAGAGFSTGIGSLLVFRAIQGFFVGAGMVVGRAVVRDLYPGTEGERLMAHISAVFGVAPAIAPIIGGWLLAGFGWRSIFYFLTGVSFLTLVACWKCLPETLPKNKRVPFHLGDTFRDYLRVTRNRAFILQCLSGGLTFGSGLGVYVSAAPDFVMNVLHLPSTAFGWLFLPIIVGMTLGSMLAARLAGQVSPDKLVWLAFGLQGASAVVNLIYMCLATTPAVPWAVMPVFFYSFGFALSGPSMMLRSLDIFPATRGLAASMQAALQMMLFALASGCIAPLVYGSGVKVAVALAVGCLSGAVCWWAGTRDASVVPQ